MEVLQAGDQLGFHFKAADETGVVGEAGQNDFERYFAPNRRLVSAVDRPEGSCTDALHQFVTFNGLTAQVFHITFPDGWR